MIEIDKVTDHLNTNAVSLEEFDALLSDYLSMNVPPLENKLLVYVLVYATKLLNRNLLSRPFDWVRSIISKPTHYCREGDDWSLLHFFSDDSMYFIEIRNNMFAGFSTNCSCTNVQRVKDNYRPWDDPIEW